MEGAETSMNEKVLLGGVILAGAVAIYLIMRNNSSNKTPMALLGARPNSTEQAPGTAYEVSTYPLQIETLGKAASS